MRIIGGKYKGFKLHTPDNNADKIRLRPTPDRVREALFNILMHGDYPPMKGAQVLDLFAGTGALGFEAFSRGAEHVTFIEENAQPRGLIRQNIEGMEATGNTKLYRRDATKLGQNRTDKFDYLFLDPPYNQSLGEKAIQSAIDGGWLADNAVIIWEEANKAEVILPEGYTLHEDRKYGETRIRILQHMNAVV